jgi:hypothetical protein
LPESGRRGGRWGGTRERQENLIYIKEISQTKRKTRKKEKTRKKSEKNEKYETDENKREQT